MKTRFIIIGYGWRADFFYRIAKMMPERFEISAGVLRTKQRAEEVAEKEGVYATENLDEALKTNPDFAVLCVPRTIVKEYLVRLMEAGLPILCETPPAQNVKELCELWEETKRLKGRVQIIEQYFLQPYYAASLEIIRKGFLGETTGVMLSALHGYHAVSMFRKYLGIGFENCRIRGQKFISDITATNGREGFDQSGKKVQFERDWASIAFDNGKTAFLDFAGEQYFSMIRARRWNIQGVKGEINDMTVRYLTEENLPVVQEISRFDVGVNNNSEWAHRGIMFLDQYLYTNPFYPARMNDDEIAVASCLEKMKVYVETGKDFYSLKEAAQDTYLSFMIEKAIGSGEEIVTEKQPWAYNS